MKEQKHTKGEWRLVNDAQGPCMIMHPTEDGVAICSLTETFKPARGFMFGREFPPSTKEHYHGEGWPEERNANARLMWASKDMYEALTELLISHTFLCTFVKNGDLTESQRGELAKVREQVRKAIAKAEGTAE